MLFRSVPSVDAFYINVIFLRAPLVFTRVPPAEELAELAESPGGDMVARACKLTLVEGSCPLETKCRTCPVFWRLGKAYRLLINLTIKCF